MDRKQSVLAIWGQIKSALAGDEISSHEDQVPRNRMKQLESRGCGLTEGVNSSEAELIDSIATQKTTVSENLMRWSTNPDRGIRQEIRQAHQLGGVAKGFAIDPLADLD
jgi:hypothetical protein